MWERCERKRERQGAALGVDMLRMGRARRGRERGAMVKKG
jgi:hypothetical protein